MARISSRIFVVLFCFVSGMVLLLQSGSACAQAAACCSTAKVAAAKAAAARKRAGSSTASKTAAGKTVGPRAAGVAAHKSSTVTAKSASVASRVAASRAAGARTVPVHATAVSAASARRATAVVATRAVAARRPTRSTGERFYASSYADNVTLGDTTIGEDPVVRAAAIEALGNMNGTALAIDPSSGRILAMVNQRLALSSGAEPCSTIKLAVALAALDEGLITRDTPVNLGGHYTLTLTKALALSVNPYFETLGRSLGFERVKYYANQFGLGELAGWNIAGEQLGVYPDTELPQAQGGVGRMCSFGESISMTPLQLGALVSAIANGGTLYYLQHPQTPDEIANFVPKVKRMLDIAPLIPEMQDGMEGAVDYGTARVAAGELQASFRCWGRRGPARITGRGLGGLRAMRIRRRGGLLR